MTLTPSRRVKTLRLTANDRSLVRRGTALLEDALRTASFPGGASHRLLLIRRLEIGRIDPAAPPASLALRIEQQMRELPSSAVHAMTPDAGSRTVVSFRDEIEPYLYLTLRLARDQPIHEWFWPMVFPGWRLDPSARVPNIRRALVEVTRQRPGVHAGITLLSQLREHGVIGQVLEVLSDHDGRALLQTYGITPGPTPAPGNGNGPGYEHGRGSTSEQTPGQALGSILAAIPLSWGQTLARSIRDWGPEDPRSIWLAGVTLLVQNPTRLLNPGLGRWAGRVAAAFNPAVNDPVSGPFDTGVAPPRPGDAPTGRVGMIGPGVGEVAPHRAIDDPSRGLPSHAADGSDDSPHRALRDMSTTPAITPTGRPPHPPSQSHHLGTPSSDRSSWTDPPVDPVLMGSRFVGLYFLIPVLTRLGIVEAMARDPALIEWGLPYRVLNDIARRLRIPEHDPVFGSLEDFSGGFPDRVRGDSLRDTHENRPVDGDTAHPAPDAFVAPPPWDGLIPDGPFTLRRTRTGDRVLWDPSDRLPLGCWRGRAPRRVHDLILQNTHRSIRQPGPRVKRGVPKRSRSRERLICDAWRRAVRCWCLRYAKIGVSRVVSRVGHIRPSRTHLDIYMNLNDADVRVRAPGLDLDPGWVPWLGRVVRFHYLSEISDVV